MTTIVIDENSHEGKAFIELLSKMRFARILDSPVEWWASISPAERRAIEQGLSDVENGNTVSHESMKERYGKWLQH